MPANKSFLGDHPELGQANVDPDFVKMFTASPEQVKTKITDRERRELELEEESLQRRSASLMKEAEQLKGAVDRILGRNEVLEKSEASRAAAERREAG